MLKIFANGKLANEVVLKTYEDSGKPYAILRLASHRHYRDKDGNRPTDFVSIKVQGKQAELCARYAHKGCRLLIAGNLETTPSGNPDIPDRTLIKADSVEFLFPLRDNTPDGSQTDESTGVSE